MLQEIYENPGLIRYINFNQSQNINTRVYFISLVNRDGVVKWRGFFKDRDAAERFRRCVYDGYIPDYVRNVPVPVYVPGVTDGEDVRPILAVTDIITADPGSDEEYTVPVDWNDSNNTVEVIAGGSNGGTGAGHGSAVSAGGGGGGAYSLGNNLTLSGTADYRVAAGNGGDGWFDGTSIGAATVSAEGGSAATGTGNVTGGVGGAAANGNGDTKYSGGDGGNGSSVSFPSKGAGGGGGSAGPSGDGKDGGSNGGNSGSGGGGGSNGGSSTAGSNASGSSGADGGDGTGGSGGGSGGSGDGGNGSSGGGGAGGAGRTNNTPSNTGGNGGSDTAFTSAGIGGGGGGGGCAYIFSGVYPGGDAGDGGDYGGGGGGGSGGGGSTDPGAPGAGAQGIIVITYTPAAGGGERVFTYIID